MEHQLWIVIPFYNEEKLIKSAIGALAAQTDHSFILLLVDNASTDTGARIANDACQKYGLDFEIITEPEKGTGVAADAGFRYAIKHGAQYIARTDADCLPSSNWVAQIKQDFDDGCEFMGGRLKPRGDDVKLRLLDYIMPPLLITIGVLYGKLFYRGKQFKYPFFMAAGGNMAITAELYEKAGGFTRSSIADTNEDTELAERVRTLTKHAKYNRKMVVFASLRRMRKYGCLNTLKWFSGRAYKGVVDVR